MLPFYRSARGETDFEKFAKRILSLSSHFEAAVDISSSIPRATGGVYSSLADNAIRAVVPQIGAPLKILIVGVYLADKLNTADQIQAEFSASALHQVDQRWIAITSDAQACTTLPHTVRVQVGRLSRFKLLNELIGSGEGFDWIVICDDDVELPRGFVDDFFAVAERFDFALCQPGRTYDSYIDLPIMQQALGLLARRTRFVEIGPLTCIRADAAKYILPFDENGMGWGVDLAWSFRMEQAYLKMGVVDVVPIAHRIRPTVSTYSHEEASAAMAFYLAKEPHLAKAEAFTVLEAYVDA